MKAQVAGGHNVAERKRKVQRSDVKSWSPRASVWVSGRNCETA